MGVGGGMGLGEWGMSREGAGRARGGGGAWGRRMVGRGVGGGGSAGGRGLGFPWQTKSGPWTAQINPPGR